MSKNIRQESLAGIQYLGIAGISKDCKDAIVKLIHFGDKIHKAKLLSCSGEHCFLLSINDSEDLVAIKSGFSSGYRGEGPHTLSIVLQILMRHGADIYEYNVSKEIIDRLDQSCLMSKDIEIIASLRPVQPSHWHDYIFEFEGSSYWNGNHEKLRYEFPKVIPFGIIDPRLVEFALSFDEHPDNSLMSGYRRLEDIIRERTGLTEHNSKLFIKAFQGDDAVLFWENIKDQGELAGRIALFTGTYMAFRNRRAHREPDRNAGGDLQEFLLLNQLYLLEWEAKKKGDKEQEEFENEDVL